jgi:hypothetical protein
MADSDQRVVVEVAEDHMQAWLRADGEELPTAEEAVTALDGAGVPVDDALRARVAEFIAGLQEARAKAAAEEADSPSSRKKRPADPAAGRFLIAEGRQMTPGRDAEFRWHESFESRRQDWQGDAAVNYYEFHSIITVEPGVPIGRITPAQQGRDGVDVCGKVIPRPAAADVRLDESVRPDPADPNLIVANVPGKVVYENRLLRISQPVVVEGDVDFNSGNVRANVDVDVSETVREGFVVLSKKSVVVGGAIEAAEVKAGEDVVVRGGILGHGRGRVRAGRDIVARFIDEGNLRAGGDIKIAKSVVLSKLHCEGKLLALHAAVVTSQAYARAGAEIGELGNDAHTPVTIAVGAHPDVLVELETAARLLTVKRRRLERIQDEIGTKPVRSRLPPHQLQRAIEAARLETEIADIERLKEATLHAARAAAPAEVAIGRIIYPRAVVRFERREVFFDKSLKGPLHIHEARGKEGTELIAVQGASRTTIVLPSREAVLDGL